MAAGTIPRIAEAIPRMWSCSYPATVAGIWASYPWRSDSWTKARWWRASTSDITLHSSRRPPRNAFRPRFDFENLSHYLQSKLRLEHYVQPTLIGYSSGATLVYAALAESPDGLFKGALSIGFCPDLDLEKPLCKGSGIEASPRLDSKGIRKGVDFLPARQLPGAWISLQGESDQVCSAPLTQKFVAAVPGGEIVMLPKVGHGYSVEKNWLPQYEAAYARLTARRPDAARAAALPAPVADLPLIVVPAAGGGSGDWFRGIPDRGTAVGWAWTRGVGAAGETQHTHHRLGFIEIFLVARGLPKAPRRISIACCATSLALWVNRTHY